MRSARRLLTAIVTSLLAVGALALPAQAAPAPATRPTDPVAHDPTMVREGAWYYVAITGDSGQPNTYLPLKRSRDLVHWQELGPVFSALPSWVISELGVTPADAWAPKLTRLGNVWALYYSASQFGTQNSVIGLATTPTLDPASPNYHWTDQGMVLRSTPGVDDFNAIDPDYVTDGHGGAWLAFGSFWGGIKMRRLDPRTGKLDTADTTLYPLASRIAPDAEEGPAIIEHGGYFYLVLSFDYCCRGVESDYRMVVGRSKSVTGPYVDRAGVALTDGGGTEVLRGYNEFIGTGGGDVYADGARTYLVNHYYDATDNGTPRLNVRPVAWSGGWPAVGDPLNPSRSVGHGPAYVQILSRTSGTPVIDVNCGYEGSPIALGTPNPADTCQQWQWGYRGNSTSSLLNRFSNKIAEVAACNNVDGGAVAQWGWIGFLGSNDCQRWQSAPTSDGWTEIRSILPGARVWDSSTGSIVVNTASATPAQEFRFAPVGAVLLIDPSSPGLTNASHRWRFTSAGGATYTITDTRTGFQLGAGSSQLRLLPPFGPGSRKWTLVPGNDGTWTISLTGTTITKTVQLLIP